MPTAAVMNVRRLGVVLLALALTACTDSPEPAATNNEPLVPPLVIEKEPLWPGSTTVPEFGEYQIRGESLLGIGGAGGEDAEDVLAVMDVATGKLRWRLRERDVLPADTHLRLGDALPWQWPVMIVENDAEWTAIVPYGDAQGLGVAALSSADGSVLWTLPVVPQPPNGFVYHNVAAVDENLVVSVVRSVPSFELNQSRIVATRIADGAVAWESAGMWPSFVVGDTVFGVRASVPTLPRDREIDADSAAVALDAATGQEKWNLADRYPRSNVYLTLGEVAVIFTAESSSGFIPRAVVVDAGNGAELADLGEVASCVDDGANLIVCQRSGRDEMVTFDVNTRKVSAATTEPFGGGWHGYFFADGRVVDREGNPVIDDLSGDRVSAMSADYVVIRSDDKITVHRVEK